MRGGASCDGVSQGQAIEPYLIMSQFPGCIDALGGLPEIGGVVCWQGYDVMEEMYSEKTAAVNFLHELCKVRTKGNLEAFMALCIGVMNEYQVLAQHAPLCYMCILLYTPLHLPACVLCTSRCPLHQGCPSPHCFAGMRWQSHYQSCGYKSCCIHCPAGCHAHRACNVVADLMVACEEAAA